MRPGRLALCELLVLVLLLVVAHLAAGGEAEGPVPARVLSDCGGLCRNTDGRRSTLGPRSLHVPPAARCPAAQHAISRYRRQYTEARSSMGLSGAPPRAWYPCQAARRRAVEWRDRAWQAKRAYRLWVKQQWAAPPEPFLSIARCENRGSGLYGVNWDAYNSVYEGAYGFLHSTWDDYKPAGYPESASTATIAQQTEVARILVATFGGYSSWPACHIKLGLPG